MAVEAQMPSARRWIWTAIGVVAVAVASFELGTRVAAPPAAPSERIAADVAALRAALDRYRADHGWYPCDPERDYNRSGRADLLSLQLIAFTRDDGKPSERRDAEFRFGPYLAEIPADALAGSRHVAIDQVRARTLRQLQADVAADNGAGGWYYEVRTGFVVPNHGRGRAPRLAGFH
jgi:hypothetical protein